MSFDVSYVSTACNQTPNIAHWGKNNLICYGSCNAVLIYDLSHGGGKIIDTLKYHTKRVNAVRWITGDTKHETELVSVSSDNDVIVWSYKNQEYLPNILRGHQSVVNVVDAVYFNDETIIVTASADSTAKVWIRKKLDGEFQLEQTIDFGYSICLALRLVVFNEMVVLACALDKSSIEVYVLETGLFEKKTSLKGHDDWVRGLDFKICDDYNLLLASSSQDAFIRLWRFTPEEEHQQQQHGQFQKINLFHTVKGKYSIIVESILSGHDGWIYSVNWCPNSQKLLSASLDKTIIIWEYNDNLNLWLETMRVGEVGGNSLGFYGAMFNSSGSGIMGHGYHGAFHIWMLEKALNIWQPQVTIGGHFNEVVDLSWDPQGDYVMSASYDQTTRIHAPWRKSDDNLVTWHEIARPQVHGYDMSCLTLLGHYKFASGAEEKIIRTFQAPDNFVQNFKRICKVIDDGQYNAPKGASVPSLGLSNKAVYENDNADQAKVISNKEPYPEESHFSAVELTEPPTEETLMQNTLWPEIQKLYGHGYELYSLASSSDGKFLASACKSTTSQHAALLLWETENWQIVQTLHSHTLTVAQIAFSPDCEHILSVSRDRRWSLFSKNADGKFQLAATTDKKTGIHTRIIWCCAWTHDSKYFATGSRDGKVVVWWRNLNKPKETVLGEYEAASEVLMLKNESITAVTFAPDKVASDYLLAVGLERGIIQLYKWNQHGFKLMFELNARFAHHLDVKRLAFRPMFGRAGYEDDCSKQFLQLASCGSDYSVRIYDIKVDT